MRNKHEHILSDSLFCAEHIYYVAMNILDVALLEYDLYVAPTQSSKTIYSFLRFQLFTSRPLCNNFISNLRNVISSSLFNLTLT